MCTRTVVRAVAFFLQRQNCIVVVELAHHARYSRIPFLLVLHLVVMHLLLHFAPVVSVNLTAWVTAITSDGTGAYDRREVPTSTCKHMQPYADLWTVCLSDLST